MLEWGRGGQRGGVEGEGGVLMGLLDGIESGGLEGEGGVRQEGGEPL